VNGEKITPEKSLPDLLYQYKKGDQVQFTLLRNEQEMSLSVQF
jgi:S1-C subfamily serine protease